MPKNETPLIGAQLRIARPTRRLEQLVRFYVDALGFDELGRFGSHGGYDGVMLGHAEAGFHLEFTTHPDDTEHLVPSAEQLLVFYLPDPATWEQARDRIEATGQQAVPPTNPYWSRCGRTYEDPDGFRIVIQQASWPTVDSASEGENLRPEQPA